MASESLSQLVELTRRIARPELDLVILAEGNTSAASSPGALWVKGSGVEMLDISADGFVEVHAEPLLAALDEESLGDAEIRLLLNAARTDADCAQAPSTEAFMHAYLLSLAEVRFVLHTHPTPLLSLLCRAGARELAGRRLFPDEIVLCGPETCFVDYVAPGLPLAQAIRGETALFIDRHRVPPRIFWLQNHGLISLGQTAREAEAATLMAVKAARVWLGALAGGQEIKSLSAEEIEHIHAWPDEHFRQKALFGVTGNG